MNKPIKRRHDTTMKISRTQNLIAAALVAVLAMSALATWALA
jgi:hypothetical protein